MELSYEFLKHLYESTGRSSFIPQLQGYFDQHEQFVKKYGSDINLSITDERFRDRLTLSADALSRYIQALDKA
jgi:hypothetical protein